AAQPAGAARVMDGPPATGHDRVGRARSQPARSRDAVRIEAAGAARAARPFGRRSGFHRRGEAERRERLADARARRAGVEPRALRRLRRSGDGRRPARARSGRCVAPGAKNRMPRAVAGAAIAITAIAGARPAAQDPPAGAAGVRVQILWPGDDAYVSGPTLLRARVEPAGAAASVVFYVDGHQVCALAKLPFECDWDAGPLVNEHQVRVAAYLANGGRVVQTVRTKALDYAERVDVDVVQVTVTVMDGRGHFVRGLPQTAFHIAEDGRQQGISHFASEDVPLELI